MKQLTVNIPGATVSYNYLYENMPLDWREEDLLFVRLPNGDVIDVGWYPACDPAGRFKVTLSDSVQNQIDTIRVTELDQVVDAVEGLALQSPPSVSLSVQNAPTPSPRSSVRAMSSATFIPPVVVQPIFHPSAVV